MEQEQKRPSECCRAAENMDCAEDPVRPGLSVETCRVCGARHFRLRVDVINLSYKGEQLG